LDRLGLSVKLDRKPLSETKFCNVYLDFETLQFIRDPIKVLCTFSWSLSDFKHTRDTELLKSLLRAKAISLACEAPNCPLLWVLAKRALELTEGVEVVYTRQDKNWLVDVDSFHGVSEPAISTRVLFAQLFNIDITTQLAVEREISGAVLGFLDGPAIRSILPAENVESFNRYVFFAKETVLHE